MPIAKLDRTVISVSGDAPEDFLSGLITNSLNGDITFTALLTPQGKIIADFFVIKDGARLLIDTPSKFVADLMKRLKMYKLRAKIDLEICNDLEVYAAWDGTGDEGHEDPRHPGLGRRMISGYIETTATADDYNARRLSLGIPDSARDFETASTFPANANMDILSGIDFKKGCFVGQEVVSRMHRKTSVRKRMQSFTATAPIVPATTLMCGLVNVGTVLSMQGLTGMAMVREDRLPDAADEGRADITAGDAIVTLTERAYAPSP